VTERYLKQWRVCFSFCVPYQAGGVEEQRKIGKSQVMRQEYVLVRLYKITTHLKEQCY